jgi:hypothetical protein
MERLASAKHRQSCGQRVALIWRSAAVCVLLHEQRLEGLCQALCAGATAAQTVYIAIVGRVGLLFESLAIKATSEDDWKQPGLPLHKALLHVVVLPLVLAWLVRHVDPRHNAPQCDTSGQPEKRTTRENAKRFESS